MPNTKIEKYIEKISNTPDTSFSYKRKLIQKYQGDITENIERLPGYTPYIEYLDKVSHIPSEVIKHIESVLDTNRSKKTFDAEKIFKQIIKKIDNVEYNNLYYKNQAQKILSNNNNEESRKHYRYNHPEKSFQNATGYSDMFENGLRGGLLSKNRIYNEIYNYCKMVENNVSLYNRYQGGESSFDIFLELFPQYKNIDFGDHKRDDMISVSLSGSGVLTIRLHAPVMSKINKFDSSNKNGIASFGNDIGIIVCIDSNQEKFFKMINGDTTDTTEHELQHIYNKFYKINENNKLKVLSDIYTKAKDEILAQIKGGQNDTQTISVMSSKYDYFSEFSKNEKYLQDIDNRIHIRKNRISRLQEINAPEVTLKVESDRLHSIMNDKNILTDGNIQKVEKEKYLQHVKTYVGEAYKFISRAKKTGLVYDPYVILANIQMNDRSSLNKKLGIEQE